MVPGLRAFGFCFLAGASLALGACGQATLTPPEGPTTVVETRVVQPKRQREIPRLIAPPPAYGNKVVLAHAERSTGAY